MPALVQKDLDFIVHEISIESLGEVHESQELLMTARHGRGLGHEVEGLLAKNGLPGVSTAEAGSKVIGHQDQSCGRSPLSIENILGQLAGRREHLRTGTILRELVTGHQSHVSSPGFSSWFGRINQQFCDSPHRAVHFLRVFQKLVFISAVHTVPPLHHFSGVQVDRNPLRHPHLASARRSWIGSSLGIVRQRLWRLGEASLNQPVNDPIEKFRQAHSGVFLHVVFLGVEARIEHLHQVEALGRLAAMDHKVVSRRPRHGGDDRHREFPERAEWASIIRPPPSGFPHRGPRERLPSRRLLPSLRFRVRRFGFKQRLLYRLLNLLSRRISRIAHPVRELPHDHRGSISASLGDSLVDLLGFLLGLGVQ